MTTTTQLTLADAAAEMDRTNEEFREATFALTDARRVLAAAEKRESEATDACRRASHALTFAAMSKPGFGDGRFWDTGGESERA